MCDYGAAQRITIRQSIMVDACLAHLIVWMNDEGIRTTGCCCGHGKGEGSVTIMPSSVDRALELGYTIRRLPDGTPEIVLPAMDLTRDEGCAAGLPVPVALAAPSRGPLTP